MNFKFPSSLEDNPNPNPHPNLNLKSNPNLNYPSNINFNRNHNSTTFSYFTHQAIRAGFTTGGDVRRPEFEFSRNPVDIRGSVERELEKERIRAEIIAEEIMRRRILEEEVRRELMLEREMAFRDCGERDFTFGVSPVPMRLEPRRVPLLTNFEHGGGGGGNGAGVGGAEVSPLREGGFRGGFESVPFQRDPVVSGSGSGSGVTLHEIKGVVASPESSSSKDKVIILAKPSANLADIKRKAMMPPAGGVVEVFKKQKSKEDWSCALCRVTATSERGLNEHLQGKKHKARERGMVAQRTGFGTGPLPKISSTNTSITLPSIINTPSLKKVGKADGESSMSKLDNLPTVNLSVLKDKHTLLKLKETSVDEEENGATIATASDKPKKKFRYFCEMCQAGAYALKVFNAHKRGKKHLSKLAELNKTAGPVKASGQKVIQKENKEAEMAAEEIKEGTEAEQVEANGDVVDGDMNEVENEEKVLEMVGGDSAPEKPTPVESACNEVDC